tara:strand:+ start:111 stop:407 length:297 start_codon:yes stop_codon:yes gene_type:complete
MIPQLVFKFFTPKIIKAIMKYVFEKNELDVKCNELDIQQRDIEQKCTDIGFKMSAMETILKDLSEESHPPVIDLEEWKDVKDTIRILKNKKVFKKLAK